MDARRHFRPRRRESPTQISLRYIQRPQTLCQRPDSTDPREQQSLADKRLVRKAERWGLVVGPEDFETRRSITFPVLSETGRARVRKALAARQQAWLLAGVLLIVGFVSLAVSTLR